MKISKKLSMAIGSCLAIIATAFSGDISWGQAVMGIVPIVIAYLVGQSAIDTMKAKNPVDNTLPSA